MCNIIYGTGHIIGYGLLNGLLNFSGLWKDCSNLQGMYEELWEDYCRECIRSEGDCLKLCQDCN